MPTEQAKAIPREPKGFTVDFRPYVEAKNRRLCRSLHNKLSKIAKNNQRSLEVQQQAKAFIHELSHDVEKELLGGFDTDNTWDTVRAIEIFIRRNL